MIGCNLSRFCLMIGEQPVDHPLKAVQILQQKLGRKMPPKEVPADQAICNQNIVEGDDIDIRIFPAQRMWPLDGGMYLGTGDAVITKDPETGRINVGTYRMMIKGPREVGVYTSPGKDATIDREKWWKMGKPMPIAAAYGIDPLLFLVAATSLPKTECEYDYYSGINGAPIEVFTSDLTGLPLPARAEIVLEGFLYPDETFAEGPFGEFTGYYGRPSGATPYMRVERVRYRDNPTLTCALMADGAANEAGLFWAALRSAGIWADLQKLGVPGIQGVWSIPEAAGWGITVVSIKQMYAGHAPQVMALAAQCTAGAYFGKYVIVVDEDVDPTNVNQVLWAMATRSRPAQSIDILRETWSTYLDPSLNPPEIRPWGSKCLINACMDYRFIKTFSKRTKLSKEAYDNVVARWQELGLSGTPPAISVFEEEKVCGRHDVTDRAPLFSHDQSDPHPRQRRSGGDAFRGDRASRSGCGRSAHPADGDRNQLLRRQCAPRRLLPGAAAALSGDSRQRGGRCGRERRARRRRPRARAIAWPMRACAGNSSRRPAPMRRRATSRRIACIKLPAGDIRPASGGDDGEGIHRVAHHQPDLSAEARRHSPYPHGGGRRRHDPVPVVEASRRHRDRHRRLAAKGASCASAWLRSRHSLSRGRISSPRSRRSLRRASRRCSTASARTPSRRRSIACARSECW